jgi:hypothetical protein
MGAGLRHIRLMTFPSGTQTVELCVNLRYVSRLSRRFLRRDDRIGRADADVVGGDSLLGSQRAHSGIGIRRIYCNSLKGRSCFVVEQGQSRLPRRISGGPLPPSTGGMISQNLDQSSTVAIF